VHRHASASPARPFHTRRYNLSLFPSQVRFSSKPEKRVPKEGDEDEKGESEGEEEEDEDEAGGGEYASGGDNEGVQMVEALQL